MISKQLIKVISIFSMIIGAIIAVPSLIPNIFYITIIVLMFLISPFVIIYLKKLNVIKEMETEKYLIIGALSGFMSFVGFSIVFFPIAFLLTLIFKIDSFIWVKVVFSNFGYLMFMVILMSLLSGLFNSFTSMILVNLNLTKK